MQTPLEITFKTSTITDGNMSPKIGDCKGIFKNQQTFAGKNNFVCMACDHGEIIETVSEPSHDMLPAEVLVTQTPGLTLMVLTADCLPVGFYDSATKTIALGHMSRTTIAHGLPQKTVGFLRQRFKVDPINLQVLIGPHIHAPSYTFPNTGELFPETIEKFVTRTKESVSIDLISALKHQLAQEGVPKNSIHASETNTFTSEKHYSHLATKTLGKEAGRFATTLSLKSV